MALSESVQEHVKSAEQSLRAALSFASRQERASTCVQLANIINDIQKVIALDEVSDNLEDMMDKLNKNMKNDGKGFPFM